MSSFGAFRNKMRTKVGLDVKPELEPEKYKTKESTSDTVADEDDNSSVASSETAEEMQSENHIQKLLRVARNKYIERGITGTINLYRLRGTANQSLTCAVTEDDVEEAVNDEEGLSMMDSKAISVFDALLNSLERASKAWKNHPYAHKVTISRGTEMGIYLPVVMNFGFCMEISFEADVVALIRSRERRAKLKQFKLALKSVDESVVEGVVQQGFPLIIAQKAAIATKSESVESALAWAVANADDAKL